MSLYNTHAQHSIHSLDAGDAVLEARRLQIQKERRQRRFFMVLTAIVAVALVTIISLTTMVLIRQRNAARSITVDQAYEVLQNVELKPKAADDKGGILLSKEGYGKKAPGAPTVEIYTDPMCPGCAVLHQQADSTLRSMVDAGQINLNVHPVIFLDHMSSDEYSSRAGNAMVYIASHDPNPDHLIDFMTNIHSDDFQPQEGAQYIPVSNDALKDQAIKAGVPEDVVSQSVTKDYEPWLQAVTQYTLRRTELTDKTGQFAGKITTPTIVINDARLDINAISEKGLTYQDAILQSLGLNPKSVGQAGAMPSIGADGKPNETTSQAA